MKKIYLCAMLAAVLTGCMQAKERVETKTVVESTATEPSVSLDFKNADFYDADGKFIVDKGRDAVIALMKYYNYPITDKTRESIWVSDYGLGRFTELGLAAISMVNNPEDGYMLQDLFLLPNQMLPEHWHLKPDKYNAKMEGWFVRYGKSYIVGEGENNQDKFPNVKVPSFHNGGKVTVFNVVEANQTDFVPLNKVLSHHWQLAGDKGAIITEVANGHADDKVRHLDKKCNDFFLGI